MSLVPVTSHPRFSAASASFQAALPLLASTTRALHSIPTELSMRHAVDALEAGIEQLEPMTAPTDMWLHQPARAAIASAQEAIQLLEMPIEAVRSGAVKPETGSAETAAAVAAARSVIARADAATIL